MNLEVVLAGVALGTALLGLLIVCIPRKPVAVPPQELAPQDLETAISAAPLPAARPSRRLRLWPGVVVLALQALIVLVPRVIDPGAIWVFMAVFIASMAGAAGVCLWWLFFSRIPWPDRLLGVAVYGLGALSVAFLSDPSIDGFGLLLYGLAAGTTAWVLALILTENLSWPIRRAAYLSALVAAFGVFLLIRHDGVYGEFAAVFNWRWADTSEGRYVAARGSSAQANRTVAPASAEPIKLQSDDWPAFRGPDRDGRRPGVKIATNWEQHPPKKLWQHLIGPGWGSFAVVDNRIFTQEQAGTDEVVVCCAADTGKELWRHSDPARFTEVVAGPGPRATPTFDDGKLYTFGATGLLLCFDAATGEVLWSRDVAKDTGAKVPQWGFSSSPLVARGLVSVFAGGKGETSTVAYKKANGERAWAAGTGELGYSSPQLATIDGVDQILMLSGDGLTALDPANGKVLWQHAWPIKGMPRCIQPAFIPPADVLLGSPFNQGIERIRVKKTDQGWSTSSVWKSRGISPYYNDFVIHKGHLFGFDGAVLTCINLEDGKRLWKERGYGNGQVLLLPDQNLLLIQAETGEVALVEAAPQKLNELSRFLALEGKGKTWNHPVVAEGRLFVRNGEEAACYQLTATIETAREK